MFFLVQESSVDEFLEKELDVAKLRILDAKGFQHSDVTIFDCHENGPQVFQIRTVQVQCHSEVLDRLGFCKKYIHALVNC